MVNDRRDDAMAMNNHVCTRVMSGAGVMVQRYDDLVTLHSLVSLREPLAVLSIFCYDCSVCLAVPYLYRYRLLLNGMPVYMGCDLCQPVMHPSVAPSGRIVDYG